MRSTSMFGSACAVMWAFSTLAHAALPQSAPVVTVGADLKQLQFDWDQVPGSNTYELWFKAYNGASWIKYTEISSRQTPRFRISVSVHLLDWRVAKYRVAACNAGGCKTSADVSVSGLALDAAGYFKPSSGTGHRNWGSAVALSADGLTMAVLAGETIGAVQNSSVVSIFRKTSTSSPWRREARFSPTSVQKSGIVDPRLGNPLALSRDGNLLALGQPHEHLFLNGNSNDGAVYLFRRQGTTWTQEQRIPSIHFGEAYFGEDVDLDDAGTTLAVAQENSDRNYPGSGETDVLRRGSNGWVRVRSIPIPDATSTNAFPECRGVSLSGDGRSLLRTCDNTGQMKVQIFAAPDWNLREEVPVPTDQGTASIDTNADGMRFALKSGVGSVHVFDKGTGAWREEDTSPLASDDFVGGDIGMQNGTVALSRDGKFLALGDPFSTRPAGGINYPDPEASGAVYVWERKKVSPDRFNWQLRRVLTGVTVNEQWLGNSVAFGNNGLILAVGAPKDPSGATGIGGSQTDTSAPERGAVWMY